MLQNKWPLIISSSIPPVSTERAGYGLRWLRWFRDAPPEMPADGGVAAVCPTKGALCNINIGPQLVPLEAWLCVRIHTVMTHYYALSKLIVVACTFVPVEATISKHVYISWEPIQPGSLMNPPLQ